GRRATQASPPLIPTTPAPTGKRGFFRLNLGLMLAYFWEAYMSFAVGSLVRARGREWVVLPESGEQMLILRPLGGSEDEVTGIFIPLERVDPATFDLPDPAQRGDERSCRLLRDAVRLGFRSSAGPFRSFARIAVEPRPSQLVPLMMALKLDPVRLLLAGDVGL